MVPINPNAKQEAGLEERRTARRHAKQGKHSLRFDEPADISGQMILLLKIRGEVLHEQLKRLNPDVT